MPLPQSTPTPQLVRLEHGYPYCEECRDRQKPGVLVGWWPKLLGDGRTVPTVCCAACHHGRVRMLNTNDKRRRR